ncbi:MAG: hypothetical protein VX874_24610 [Pseudomonadota bacterium]|nr:hypothetical protein [Pseudomonadota bacterium]
MARQHGHPVFIANQNAPGVVLSTNSEFNEEQLQHLVHEHPEALPINEIDAAFEGAISICTELNTPAGPIDNFLITPSGLPVIVECKLWRNPQARREVVGQVLDYAKELARWSSADIEREAARRGVPSIIDLVRSRHPEVDEADFHDTLTTSLERGRCLLLILGDGIRGGVEAIFEHLHDQGALQFSFGLVEMPIYDVPGGGRLALPRVLAKAPVEVRRVVELPAGLGLEDKTQAEDQIDPDTLALGDDRAQFWREFLAVLDLDDPDQPIPRAPRQGFIAFVLPAPGATAWINVYRNITKGNVGLSLAYTRDTTGSQAVEALMREVGDDFIPDLGGTAARSNTKAFGPPVDERHFGDLSDAVTRAEALEWLADRTNTFINVLRPAIRSAVADIEEVDG